MSDLQEPVDLSLALPGAIEAQELRGQTKLVAAMLLPCQYGARDGEIADAALIRWGWKLGGSVADDKLFRHAEMPGGWSKRATDHAMHIDVIDGQERRRVGIFYKAAFYDRKAHFVIRPRYAIHEDYDEQTRRFSAMRVMDFETGEALFRPEEPNAKAVRDKIGHMLRGEAENDAHWLDYGEREIMREAARAWLLERFPDLAPGAYWS